MLNIIPLFLRYAKDGTKPVEFQCGVANNGEKIRTIKANGTKKRKVKL